MKQRDGAFVFLPSPLRFFFTVLAIVFLAEAATMLLLQVLLPGAHSVATSIADASLLVVLSAPFLWWFVVRPLRSTAVTEHERGATVLEHALDGIITIDEQGLVVSFNPAAERIFSYMAEEVLGKPLMSLMPERYRDAHRRGLERVSSTGEFRIIGKTVEMHGLRQDGGEFPLELSLATWKTGKGTFYTGVVRDITERKQAEDRLRLQGTALESAANAIFIADREGRITWVNRAFTNLTGYTQDEVLGRNPRLLKSGKHDQAFYQHLWETILSGQVWHGETINKRKDGSLYAEAQTITPVRGEHGEISHFIAIKQDITEGKRVEEARARLSAILEVTTDFVGIADIHGKAIYLNSGGRKMLGIEEDEDISNIRIPDTHPEWASRIVLDEGIPTAIRHGVWSGETALLSRDGLEIPVSQVILAHKAPDGTVEFLSTIARDITERKRAEATRQALYQASLQVQEPLGLQERLNRILETAQTVLKLDRINILLPDREGRWLQAVASIGTEDPVEVIRVPIGPEGGGLAQAYLTQQATVWNGHAPLPEGLRLKPPYDRISALRSQVFANVPLFVQGRAIGVLGADRKHSRDPLDSATIELLQLFSAQAALAIEHGRLYEAQRMAAIQLEATVEARTRELQAANGQLQEAMREVQAASRHKSAFLANMSHELRTPLNSILGFSELLAQQAYGPLTEKQARYVDNVHTSGQHLLALINGLLDLSKVEAGKLELQPQAFNLREALEAALHVLRPQAEAKQQALSLQVADDLSALTADPLRVRQILYNLLSNAVKFTPAGGAITVTAKQVRSAECGVRPIAPRTSHLARRTSHDGDYVEIAVADTGIGIKPDDLPKLFQLFTQLEQTFTKSAQGTGLGLALTRHLVELHGGTIWAESAGEGRGSTFTVWLPLPSPAS